MVIVPGIGGSVLKDARGKVVWGGGPASVAGPVLWPRLLERPELTPAGLLDTIRFAGPLALPGYDELVRQISNAFTHVRVDVAAPGAARDPGADVVLFPYDFRASIAEAAGRLAAEVRERLGPPDAPGAARRVIVIGHSMGGLVARYWLGPLGGAPYCRALISVGTPHRGAPKALAWLHGGVKVGPLSHPMATRVLRQWPSAHELMPRYPAVLDGAEKRYPYELGWPYADGARMASDAFRVHTDIEDAWDELAGRDPANVPEVLPLFGRGHGTPRVPSCAAAG